MIGGFYRVIMVEKGLECFGGAGDLRPDDYGFFACWWEVWPLRLGRGEGVGG